MNRNKRNYIKKIAVALIFLGLFLIALAPFIGSSAEAELTSADFSDLSYTDPKGDQYTHFQEFDEDSSTEKDSYGVKGKRSETFDLETSAVDIVKLTATLSSGTVTITVEYATDILYGFSLDYRVCFVDSSHEQPDDLLNPETQKQWLAYWDKVNDDNCLVEIVFDYDDWEGTIYAWSTPDLPSITAEVDGNIITYTVSASDLEDVGVNAGSGFGLYAYAHLIGSTFGDPWKGELTWDTAGVGAADAPDEYNVQTFEEISDSKKSAEFPLMGALVCGVIIIVVVVVIVILIMRYKKRQPTNVPPNYPYQYQDQNQEQYPPQPPQTY